MTVSEAVDIIKNTGCVRRQGKCRKNSAKYKDLICAFDIETTRLPEIEQSIMYIWQFQLDELGTIFGRTWDEFTDMLQAFESVLGDREHLVIYVHNLSYEFQFLAGIYDFQAPEVFAMDSRKVLKCSMYHHFEFRCSYIQTNMSLDQFTRKMNVEHQKLSGADFDYDKRRYPWTPMSDSELEYCRNDVLGLVEAIKAEMRRDGDSLYTIPLTSTGYVRRDAKKVMSQFKIHNQVKECALDLDLYAALRQAFRGGDTHCSRFYSNRIVENVDSVDRSSSYPDVIVNRKFPVTPFYRSGAMSIKDFKFHSRTERAMVLCIRMTNVRLRNHFSPVPYLAVAKCQATGVVNDNGRIIAADYIDTVVTDIDFRIILDEYEADGIEIYDSWHSRYGYLPVPYRELVKKYYRQKTELKGVKGQEVYYDKSKALLNALYGLMAQDPIKQTIEFVDGQFIEAQNLLEDLLEQANQKAFLCYQYGVWVTAWARWELRQAINNAGPYFVYGDTDSVKYVRNESIQWDSLNQIIMKRSQTNGAYATDPKGITHYMGVWEHDDSYDRFKSMGAKKYVTETGPDKELHCTVAGVSKRAGAKELQAAGGLEKFATGFIFVDAGGLESVYNDFNYGHYHCDGRDIWVSRNVVLRPSTYTVGLTADYARLLQDNTIIKKFMEDFNMAQLKTKAEKSAAEKKYITEITKVNVWPTDGETIIANASVVINDCIVLTGLKIINGKRGAFVSMPSVKVKDEYRDIYFPITKEFREAITNAVIEAYNDIDEDE